MPLPAPLAELRAFTRASLVDKVVASPPDPPRLMLRRRVVVGLSLVLGAFMLRLTLHEPPGSRWFVPAALGLAAVWTLGAFLSGPLHAGLARTREGGATRPVLQPFLVGLGILVVFLVGGVVVAHIAFLRSPVEELLNHSSGGSLPLVLMVTVLNGIAEELFFRGAAFSASAPLHPVIVTTIVYTLVTVLSGVPLLVLAAAVVGFVTALQRRVSGGVLAPVVTHLTWSVGMLLLLPPVLHLAR